MTKKTQSVSFIVPALNEEEVVERVAREIVGVCRTYLSDFEVILVDDGSTDHTGAIMDRLAQEVTEIAVLHNQLNRGFGGAFKRGLAQARKEYVMALCGDGGFPAESLPPVFEKLGTADIIVPHMSNLRSIKTLRRYILSRGYTNLMNLLFNLRLNYYNGQSLYRVDQLRPLDIRSDGFGFQGEILVKLIKGGATFVQVGVLGAENTHRSSALRLRNIVSVMKTFINLIVEVNRYMRHIKRGTC